MNIARLEARLRGYYIYIAGIYILDRENTFPVSCSRIRLSTGVTFSLVFFFVFLLRYYNVLVVVCTHHRFDPYENGNWHKNSKRKRLQAAAEESETI